MTASDTGAVCGTKRRVLSDPNMADDAVVVLLLSLAASPRQVVRDFADDLLLWVVLFADKNAGV